MVDTRYGGFISFKAHFESTIVSAKLIPHILLPQKR